MTILSNSASILANPNQNYIKFSGGDLVTVSGSNVIAKQELCSVRLAYKQYQKISLQIPAGATDFLLNFSMLGLKITLISIKPMFCGSDTNYNYLKWKFQSSSDAKLSMTSILVLTGTTATPVQSILLDNPNPDCAVAVDILVAASENDGLNDVNAFLYLQNLSYDNIHTFNETNSGILALFNSDGDLVGTVNISNISNITYVSGYNRIVIDETSGENIILDFTSESEALQAQSALNWLLLDPANRSLPQSEDTLGPIITLTGAVSGGTMTVDLSLYGYNYTRQNVIDDAILSIIDARDGVMYATVNDISITQSGNSYTTISNPGIYDIIITVKDIAGNTSTTSFQIDSQNVIIDTTPPIITFTANVIGNTVNSIDLFSYPSSQFAYSDARTLMIQSVSDNIDGVMSINDVDVLFFDVNNVPINSTITQEGNYTIRLTVTDSHSNTYTNDFTIYIDNTGVDSSPEIEYTTNVNAISMTANIDLSIDYGSGVGTFTPSDAVSYLIQSVLDDIDGPITPVASNANIFDNTNTLIANISAAGTYNCVFTITDSTLNTTVKIITLTVI